MASSSEDYVEGPRHAIVTDDDVGPIITIVSLFLMVVMILAVTLRLLVRFTTTHVPGADDAVISIALLMAIGQVVAVYLTVNRGLGTRLEFLTTTQLVAVEKGVYAVDILYVLTLALSKASTLFLLRRLTVSRAHKIAGRAIVAVISAWTLAALFGAAFKCNLPNPWGVTTTRCLDLTSFWTAIGTVDIILDVALVAMPITIVWALQMPVGRRVTIIVGFAFRLVLVVTQVMRLIYLHRYGTGTNVLLSSMAYFLATVFETTLAVIVACIPAFRPFLDRARSGLFGVSFQDRRGTYQLSSMKNSRGVDRSNARGSRARSDTPAFARPHGDYEVRISASSNTNIAAITRQRSNLDHIAQKTVEWEISYSDSEKSKAHPIQSLANPQTSGEAQSASTAQR